MSEHGLKPVAALSVDLDNLWTYQRSSGDPDWERYASFLGTALPRLLELFDRLDVAATLFAIGRDARVPATRRLLESAVEGGHEIANHSFDHAPDFLAFDRARLENDFEHSEAALAELVGGAARGFRAPSFALSREAAEVLASRGYTYDSSTFPTIAGPVARLYERLRFSGGAASGAGGGRRYGGFAAARQPLSPRILTGLAHPLLELPVTTMPLTRLPVHWTYLFFLAARSPALARAYLATHLGLAARTGVTPVLLLHPTDVLGCDDAAAPSFMPGMSLPAASKRAFLETTLAACKARFELVPMGTFAGLAAARSPAPLSADVLPAAG